MSEFTEEELSMLSEEERAGIEAKEEAINPDVLKEIAGEEVQATPPPEPTPEPPKVELEKVEPPAPEPTPKQKPVVTETPAPILYDFDAAEDRYSDALIDGNKELARQIRKEIREKESELYRHQTNTVTAEKLAEDKLNSDVAQAAADAYKKYPFLNHHSKETMNTEAIEEVRALAAFYVDEKGMRTDAAIRAATEKVGPRYVKDTPPAIPVPRPSIQTLANVPVVEGNNPDNSKWAALDRLEGEAFETAVEKLSPSEREEYLSR